MTAMFLILAFLAGALMPVQAGLNFLLKGYVGHSMVSALISFLVGSVGLGIFCLVARIPLPSFGSAMKIPAWLWTGGLLGAFFVVMSIILAPRLGAATMVAFIVAGQLTGSIILDHFGLIGFQVHPVNMARVIGIVLIVMGTILIQKF